MKLAFMGFRHGHIMGLYESARRHPGVAVVGACEEDAAAAKGLREGGKVELTYDSYQRMLGESGCEAVAVGDYFGRRGEVILQALAAGKHVLSDKPICTRLSELEMIERVAGEKRLRVGCMLDMRVSGVLQGLRAVLSQGRIGEVQTVNFTAQHPLLPATRPKWYFEPGKHGGVLNDIGLHALDLIEWATGRRITEVIAARGWNLGRTPSHFQEAGQMMLGLDNGGGVLGDVSYLAPDGCGYHVPQYWRVVVHGKEGVAEVQGQRLTVATHASSDMENVECPANVPTGILDSFLEEVAGRPATAGPSTAEVLRAARLSLLVQAAADANRTHVALPR